MLLSCPRFYDIQWCVEKPSEGGQQRFTLSYVIWPKIEKSVYKLMKVLYLVLWWSQSSTDTSLLLDNILRKDQIVIFSEETDCPYQGTSRIS